MGVGIILKIAGIGMLAAVVNTILKKSDKDELSTFVTIACLVMVLMIVVDMVGGLFDTIKSVFGL
ncbi:MAG: stage III sporulation protein AC [Eubacteriales bacterium]|jgi:stage III sporulation protein AC|nr:stage III sporulation protein AC [Faecalibacterium sp.]MDD7571452.1 stage III sporulation protein AC [Faecalibacterium sp.]MDY3256277.1 stage III sporulation protein AC [Eubacteriales bacterium]MDY6151146.1 stage III sporulation protein AC [Eubacteriales bacterium]CCY03813.1 stage III sporulation protein AC [Faecalibacterium sp. CAG:1138]